MKKIFEIGCSGLIGVLLTIIFQYFFVKPQSFTFVYDGNEVIVTESTYTELIENNKKLEDELEKVTSKENITKVIKSATEYWNNSEYVQALTILKNTDINSDDIITLYQNYSKEYNANILDKVNSLISERKYDEAKEIIIESKDLVYDSTLLEDKLTEISNNKPIKLSSFKISASRYFDLNEDKTLEDTVGNKYSNGNLFITRAEGDTRYGYATFYLGRKYTGLSGTIAVSDESENRSDIQLEGWIEIYSKTEDEYNQLYSSPMLSRMISPITIPEVNLNNADWLEIRYHNNGNYFSLARGYHSLEILLSDFMVYSG